MFHLPWDAIWGYLQTNQFLVGGIGTVAAGSLMYVFRETPRKIHRFLHSVFTIEVDLNSQFPLYYEVLNLLTANRVSLFSRSFSVDEDSRIVSGWGSAWVFYNGRLINFSRRKDTNKNFWLEDLSVTIYSRNKDIFQKMLAEAKLIVNKDVLNVYNLEASYSGWGSPRPRSKRNLNTVFVPQKTKTDLINKIDWFLKNRKWYEDRGINYKLIIALHGPPGTGKTSLIRAIASHFNYQVGLLESLNNISGHVAYAPENSFLVAEDIDRMANLKEGKKKKNTEQESNPAPNVFSALVDQTMHKLLQAFDGLNTPDGMIMFLTTNHLSELDPALIRPGRVDCLIEIGSLEYDDMALMFESFYPGFKVRDMLPPRYYTPMVGAKLQEIFMSNDAAGAVKALSNVELSKPLALSRKTV